MGIKQAGHMIYDPNTEIPLLVPVACPVANRSKGDPRLTGKLKIRILPGSMAYRIYQKSAIEEEFHCSFELNMAFQGQLEAAGLKITGLGENGEARIIELPDHRFYFGTGYIPQLTSAEGNPHPVFIAYLKAILNHA